MSNPHVTISGFSSTGSASNDNVSWAMNVFGRENFYFYKEGETPEAIDPDSFSSPFNMVYPLSDMEGQGVERPEFIGPDVWKNNYASSPSVYVTANNSVMPKLIGPSMLLVSNGLSGESPEKTIDTYNNLYKANYNWKPALITDEGIHAGSLVFDPNIFNTSTSDSCLWINVSAKGETSWDERIGLALDKSELQPSSVDSANIDGAFSIVLNVTPVLNGAAGADGNGGTQNPEEATETDPSWFFKFNFGDVHAEMTDVASLKVKIDGGTGEVTSVNLASAQASEGTPQGKYMYGNPFLLTFLKCWNGVVVSAGRQDSSQVRHTASSVCYKYRDFSLHNIFTELFNREAPKDIEVPMEYKDKDFNVDFGTELNVLIKNCKVQIAYLPNFFVQCGTFDNMQLLNLSTDDTKYTTQFFTLYTLNNTQYHVKHDDGKILKTHGTEDSGLAWNYWRFQMQKNDELYSRAAPEIFGYVIKSTETQKIGLRNSNGDFNFHVSGTGAQCEEHHNWERFVTKVSVSTNFQGSSGSIEVDALGYAGTGASIIQSIGGISISASGGNHTHSGTIFKGIAMGISDNGSSGGHTVTIPLVGVEKKLQDMALIIPPFMDGWTLAKACNYLFGYAGISYAMHGNGGLKLSSSTSINSAIFDWKTGTPVEQALNDVMQNTHHVYVIIDGKAEVYELGDDGIPTTLGPDRGAARQYTDTVTYNIEPDFDDLRNYCVAMGVVSEGAGAGTQLESLPLRPLVVVEENATVPKIGWARVWAQARAGYTQQSATGDAPGTRQEDSLDEFVKNMKKKSKLYYLKGRVTVAGDARIKPYDKWGTDYFVEEVSHEIDLESKTWTTSVSLAKDSDSGSKTEAPVGGGW